MAQIEWSRNQKTTTFAAGYASNLLAIRDGLSVPMAGSERRLADIRSAFNAVARLHRTAKEGSDVEIVLGGFNCSPRSLLQFLDRHAAIRAGYLPGSWNNLRSRVLRGVRCFQELQGAPLPPKTLSAPWARLFATLQSTRERVTFNSFARFCERRDALPEQVCTDLIADYQRYINDFRLRSRPREAALAVASLWNRYANHNPLWPKESLEIARWTNRYALPLDDFGPTFASEVRARQASRLKSELFAETPHRQIRPITAVSQVHTIRRLATLFVKATSTNPKDLHSLNQLVHTEAVKAVVKFTQARISARNPGMSTTLRLSKDVWFLAMIASEQPDCDAKTIALLKRGSRNLLPAKIGMTEKNQTTLEAFDDPKLLGRLLCLSSTIRDRMQKRNVLRRADAVVLRNALAVDVLLNCPIRMKNLASIHLTRNLSEVGSKTRIVSLHFPAHEVKNSTEIEFVLPDTLVVTLDKYKSQVLPLLAVRENEFLFPGHSRGHKRPCALGTQIAKFVERELGVRITPHQFRHLVAKLYLQQNPGQYEVVRRFLGHTNIQTTIKFYAEMQMTQAGRHWDQVLQGLRVEAIGSKKALRARRRLSNEARA